MSTGVTRSAYTSVKPVSFGVHATNIVGVGAVQLAQSLLPALERVEGFHMAALHLPDRGPLANYRRQYEPERQQVYRRLLPNLLSRFFECLFGGARFYGSAPLLVLGDIPIRCAARQVVFVQTTHLISGARADSRKDALKYALMRWIFKTNIGHASALIVQTEAMRVALIKSYPSASGKVLVIHQPVPSWLLASGLRRAKPSRVRGQFLRLFYPAAGYAHKNHKLLAASHKAPVWPVEQLVLTLPLLAHPAPDMAWVRCVGSLASSGMLQQYGVADAVLFLSKTESYGFPLLEAMWLGLPLICPNLPYARVMCGDTAIYFESNDIHSLHRAVCELHERLDAGWWPDWSEQLQRIPSSWSEVARDMLACIQRFTQDLEHQ